MRTLSALFLWTRQVKKRVTQAIRQLIYVWRTRECRAQATRLVETSRRDVIRRLWWTCAARSRCLYIRFPPRGRTLLCQCRSLTLRARYAGRDRTRFAGCWSAMHKRALPKDYDYFIALYARVVKFTCHFNNWLPAGVQVRVAASGDRAEDARGPRRWMVFNW